MKLETDIKMGEAITEMIAKLRKKFETEMGYSPNANKKDLKLIYKKPIKPPCEYCGKFSCYGDCA